MYNNLGCLIRRCHKLPNWDICANCTGQSSLTICTLIFFLGMDEALEHLERLNEYNFHIPEDLAIRHLTKINDAFGDT